MKKRVLMLVPSLGMGGMERVCVNYANLLTERGYDVTLMNLTSDSPMIVEKLHNGVHYLRNTSQRVPGVLRAGFKNIVKGRFRVKHIEEWIRETNPQKLYKMLITDNPNLFDIEIAFYGGHMMKIISGSNQTSSIKIGWIHSPEIETHYRLFHSIEEAKYTYRSMDLLMCVSEIVKEKALCLFGNQINAQVIYNPNDISLIRRLSREGLDDALHTRFTFINASRIDMEHKGFDRLISAIKRLKASGFTFAVWILGDGKDKDKLIGLIKDSKVEDIVLYMGAKENPYKYISAADCYICSSRWEGFSMVVAETVILGTPVISTDISGAREMLGDSEYGLIVENSEDGIYEGMKKVLSENGFYERMKSQAQKRKDFLSEDRIMDKFDSIIKAEFDRRYYA